MRIKNWSKFQHYNKRRPPWIKLHIAMLEQRDINVLADRTFRILISLWLLASEDVEMKGNLPDIEDIAFRLRMDESEIIKALKELGGFIVDNPHIDDSKPLAQRKQVSMPETETETKSETESTAVGRQKPPDHSKHFSQKIGEYFEDIKSTCQKIARLPTRNGRQFKPFQWVQQKANKNGHPAAIQKTLSGVIDYWNTIDDPWKYAESIFKTTNQNYNERSHIEQAEQFKQIVLNPELLKMIENVGTKINK